MLHQHVKFILNIISFLSCVCDESFTILLQTEHINPNLCKGKCFQMLNTCSDWKEAVGSKQAEGLRCDWPVGEIHQEPPVLVCDIISWLVVAYLIDKFKVMAHVFSSMRQKSHI
jgi:hypothetical protein